jgi:hypothetical protein
MGSLLQVAMRLFSTAAVRPPWSLPKNIQFFRLWKYFHNRNYVQR